ncbi:MAG: hypothetical protein ACREP7_13840, partial [Lysobacter sp.]
PHPGDMPMRTLLSAVTDALIFLLSWGLWRLLGRCVPLAALPIVIGLVLAAGGRQRWACLRTSAIRSAGSAC